MKLVGAPYLGIFVGISFGLDLKMVGRQMSRQADGLTILSFLGNQNNFSKSLYGW